MIITEVLITLVDAVIKAAAGEYKADATQHKSGGPSIGTIIILIVLFIIMLSVFKVVEVAAAHT